MTSSCFSSFFVDKSAESDRVVSVSYAQPLSGQTVLVSIKKSHYTETQQWTMCEETLGLHTAFHAYPIIPERNFYWIRQTSLQLSSFMTSSTNVPLITENSSLFPFGPMFACKDGTIKQTFKQSLSDTNSRNFNLPKGVHISSMSLSPNGCVCVAVSDRCDLYIYGDQSMSMEHITVLLQHSLATGVGWEDILLCIKSGMCKWYPAIGKVQLDNLEVIPFRTRVLDLFLFR